MNLEDKIRVFLTTEGDRSTGWPQEIPMREDIGRSGPGCIPLIFNQATGILKGLSTRWGQLLEVSEGARQCQLCTYRMVTLIRSMAYKDIPTSQNVASFILQALDDTASLAKRCLAALVFGNEASENEQLRVMSQYDTQVRVQYNKRQLMPTILTSAVIQSLIRHLSSDKLMVQTLCALSISVHDRDRAPMYQDTARKFLRDYIARMPDLQGHVFSTLRDESMFLTLNAISAQASIVIAGILQVTQ